MEADYFRKKLSGDTPANGAGATNTSRAARQIDAVACERADRDAHIESRHARQDKVLIKRKQDVADWECGRTLPVNESSAPAPPKPKFIPGPVRNPSPTITNCDGAGCWDSNGARYNRGGGNTYFGPNGACTGTAGGMVCP